MEWVVLYVAVTSNWCVMNILHKENLTIFGSQKSYYILYFIPEINCVI